MVVAAPDLLSHDPEALASTVARLGLRFSADYQPVVDLRSGETVAFEALARFLRPDRTSVPPAAVFAALHSDRRLLFAIELATKRLQLARAPGSSVWVNVDPDAFAEGGLGGGNAFVRAVRAAPEREVVVEVIENVHLRDADLSTSMIATLREAGVPVALDAIGADDGLLSIDSIFHAQAVKLDAAVTRRLADPRRRRFYARLVGAAREAGLLTVLEGVESDEQLAAARELGVDRVQGFLFRERFVSIPF
jgi:EAL domain-containing protein (putative c-di-GMP-specific phosphodiesterase class I)